ncbi:hypothetical protein ACJX0J_022617, partial [Zea mays]
RSGDFFFFFLGGGGGGGGVFAPESHFFLLAIGTSSILPYMLFIIKQTALALGAIWCLDKVSISHHQLESSDGSTDKFKPAAGDVPQLWVSDHVAGISKPNSESKRIKGAVQIVSWGK